MHDGCWLNRPGVIVFLRVKPPHLKRKAEQASDESKAIAWRAQKRLCGRYSELVSCWQEHKEWCA